ncbi:MAG: hypothetical protein QM699_02675 [Amaricoccus sp.]|uniref:hypothetical protein n=1 Tax=Amaricoccus sp. TaxID=1872485 RepID=UPI0039E65980
MSPEARAFAAACLAPMGGAYAEEISRDLGANQPTEFHAPWTAETEDRLHRTIDARFAAWQARARPE